MNLSQKPITDLVQIVANGGGLMIEGSRRPQVELVQLAAHAGKSGAKIILSGMAGRSQTDLVQIAANGKGNVVFAD